MALSAAEKQKRYRERRDTDPEKRGIARQKRKEQYELDKELGKRKLVSAMTAREKRHQRRYWRVKQKLSREKKKIDAAAVNMILLETPGQPQNLEHDGVQIQQQNPENKQVQGQSFNPERNAESVPGSSRQLKQALKKKHRESVKKHRERKLLLQKLQAAERRVDMYRKRWKRLEEAKSSDDPDTPRTKTSRLLRSLSRKTVRRTLNFHHALLAQLRKNSEQRNKKRTYDEIITGSIIKKYKMTGYMKKEIGINFRHERVDQHKKGSLSTRVREQVRHFYERDDNSRITTGKKRTVTRKKIKMQKRLLTDSIKNLHVKFVAETDCQISLSTFWRLKPFWVKVPTQRERETCICRTCDNIQMKASALAKANVIDNSDMARIVENIFCSTDNQTCMYGLCQTCKVNIVQTKRHDEDEEIIWHEWKTVKENRTIKKDKQTNIKGVTITKKVTKCGTIKNLKETFQSDIKRYKKHLFNIRNQLKYYRQTKHNLKENECFIHIDFSENYVGKYAKETTNIHYGASRPQITLHTGYYQIGNNSSVPFTTVSDSMQHGPAAIWAFMKPVQQEIRTKYPDVDYIHFYIDGPSTQYRQKNNFFLLCTEIYILGFKGASWNFHEAGHGKGIPGGIGGTIKRMADRRVMYGADIMNSKDLIYELRNSGTKIELFFMLKKNPFISLKTS